MSRNLQHTSRTLDLHVSTSLHLRRIQTFIALLPRRYTRYLAIELQTSRPRRDTYIAPLNHIFLRLLCPYTYSTLALPTSQRLQSLSARSLSPNPPPNCHIATFSSRLQSFILPSHHYICSVSPGLLAFILRVTTLVSSLQTSIPPYDTIAPQTLPHRSSYFHTFTSVCLQYTSSAPYLYFQVAIPAIHLQSLQTACLHVAISTARL